MLVGCFVTRGLRGCAQARPVDGVGWLVPEQGAPHERINHLKTVIQQRFVPN
jgi:hypothetical protein